MARESGILLHPTALPGPLPVGDLGEHALLFIDFLVKAGQGIWQILPMGPTGYGHSPYNALSAYAGNPVLIDLKQLTACGDLDSSLVAEILSDSFTTEFEQVQETKQSLLRVAAQNFFDNGSTDRKNGYVHYCKTQSYWLEDFCLFMALKGHFDGQPWHKWPIDIRERHQAPLRKLREQLAETCNAIKYQQFVFSRQWQRIKDYANHNGVRIFGDIPIFVAYDSADVWSNQKLFQLDEMGQTTAVAGVPPDYFSKTGQRWGNPLYQWEEHIAEDFSWWLKRFHHQLTSYDLVRIDHFRGFQACWSIPAGEKTAINGHWEEVPGRQLFTKLQHQFPELPIIAEDLGIITQDVERLRDDFNFPGMKILQFAFDSGPDNPYLPENHVINSVVYTGTHDNDTTLGWWQKLAKAQKDIIRDYLGTRSPEMPWQMIELAMSSIARLCIIPCQDILALDSKARFNTPGRATGNWEWQLEADNLSDDLAHRLRELSKKHGRIAHR